MTATALAPLLKTSFLDNNGKPLVGGLLNTYIAGTNTPIATWTDSTGITQNSNPIVLDYRGSCNCWLLPNVAYKFTLTDSLSNLIFTVDQVTNAQLITLYGGVDTGSVNSYILNFAAPYSSLVDGIFIYWIPANSNTGASTINVNGLGTLSIINQNGTALTANELLAGQIAGIMYKGGNWILVQGAQQGLVAWGGTDTGTPNVYVVPLTNQYFSYQAGNVLFFIPNNTNTGASTINVKGLGAQSILPASGGTLPAGSIIAGTLTQIVYTGSFFRLIYPNYSSGTFTLTATGMTTSPTMTVKYFLNNNQVTLLCGVVVGTSNATSFTLTGFPNGLQGPSQAVQSPLLPGTDNGAATALFWTIQNQIGGSTVILSNNTTAGTWTASGTKQATATSFSYWLT